MSWGIEWNKRSAFAALVACSGNTSNNWWVAYCGRADGELLFFCLELERVSAYGVNYP
jgi:hypothetical protein